MLHIGHVDIAGKRTQKLQINVTHVELSDRTYRNENTIIKVSQTTNVIS